MIWDRLEHQSTVYDASYAAVPHLIRIAGLNHQTPDYNFFLLPTMIEVNHRLSYGEPLPTDPAADYHNAIQQLPKLASQFVDTPRDEPLTRSIAAAVALAKGHTLLADVMSDLRPEIVEAYYQWKGWKYHQHYLETHNSSAASDT